MQFWTKQGKQLFIFKFVYSQMQIQNITWERQLFIFNNVYSQMQI